MVDIDWGGLSAAANGGTGDPMWPAPTDPMAVARRILGGQHDEWGYMTLRRWRGGWTRWSGPHWAEVEEMAVRGEVYDALEHVEYIDERGKEPTVRRWEPSRRKVSDVLEAMAAIALLAETADAPSWLDATGPFPATEMVACANTLLHAGTRRAFPHDPNLFNLVSVPFDHDPKAPNPEAWLRFLGQVWPDDARSIAALQEFFGYVLSGRTDLHKIALIVGPTRSGKGTIARVLAALIGRGNAAGPTLASLGTNFGLAPLLGKPLAVVSDARLGRGNTHQVVERLLSISGEDMLTVDRKYRDPWTGKLPARFLILSNELPRLGDASAAIANRFLVLTMRESFLGRENTGLTNELLAELPGVLAWSLDGLDRLTRVGIFTKPRASDDAIIALQDLASPVAAFVRDLCDIRDRTAAVVIDDLFNRWKVWCEDNGHRAGSVQTFGRDLAAVVPGLRVWRPHEGKRQYLGVRLQINNGLYRGSSGSEAVADGSEPHEPRHNPLLNHHANDDCDPGDYALFEDGGS
jgi:putative DNA primase/helicase